MSTATPNQPDNKEEIDLGVLFNAIGNGISKLFNAISSTILFILNGVLTFVVFIREKIVYYAIACGVGLAIGIAFEVFMPKEYSGSSTVQPYFDSARQLYSNINYLDGLAAQKDSIQLSRFFGISPKEAASINSVEITPFVSQIKSRQAYNKYVTALDSIVAAEITYDDYEKQLDKFDSKVHLISVKATDKEIYSSLLDPILASVSDQDYFKQQQITAFQNLELNDSITQVSMVQTDTLLKLFEKVRIVEANKEFSNGTNLYMSDNAEDNAEIALLERKIELSERLEEIRNAKLETMQVVDVISQFPEVGFEEKHLLKNKKIQGIIIGFILLSLFYLILHIDPLIATRDSKK